VTARSQRAQLFEAARALAAVLADNFFGSVEIHVHNGSVGIVKVVQTLKESDKGDNR